MLQNVNETQDLFDEKIIEESYESNENKTIIEELCELYENQKIIEESFELYDDKKIIEELCELHEKEVFKGSYDFEFFNSIEKYLE
ncbi:1427_t:CDS:1, partial [Cetraspora pellucida]